MPREYAKNLFSQWSDEDFCNQPLFDKLLYQVLCGQRAVNSVGVQPINFKRWRNAMRDGDRLPSELDVKAALVRMERRRYVYTDEITGEVLIRSRIRRDELEKQPNQFLGALRLLAVLDSPKFGAVMLAELARMSVPEVQGDKPQAITLRKNLAAADAAARTHLRTLSEGISEPFPEPFAEDFPRPAEIGTPQEPFRDGSVSGSVSGSLTSVGTQVGSTRESAPTDNPQPNNTPTNPPEEPTDEPPSRCKAHRGFPADAEVPNCGPCANFRQAHERWVDREHRRRAQAASEAAHEAAALRTQAIQACELCDDDGYRHGTHIVCDHEDRTQTHARGRELVRAALAKTDGA